MESAFLVNNIDVVRLKFHDPPCIQCRRIFHLHQGLEGGVVSDNVEGFSFKEMSVMFHSPNNSELFQLRSSVILHSPMDRLACITDDSFAENWVAFSVKFSMDWEILCENGTKASATCICVQLEDPFHRGTSENRGRAKFFLEDIKGFLGFVCPFERDILLESAVDWFCDS